MAVHRVVIHYPKHLIDSPLVSKMVRKYNLEFNLLRANITPQSEGLMVLGLEGAEGDIQSALAWARGQGLRVQPLEKDVTRNDERCTQCGACVTICPSKALYKDAQTQEVRFAPDECIACELCVPVCPPRAMEVRL
jgi:ferredoxin